ncbi:MAG: hypothetical protein OER82_10755 [Nitrosopumilus sp.]|nr:hypothetical protein [Nitrosopumilus sp.]
MTDSVSGAQASFIVGAPADFDPETEDFDGVGFDLTPVFDGKPKLKNLQAVCVGPAA